MAEVFLQTFCGLSWVVLLLVIIGYILIAVTESLGYSKMLSVLAEEPDTIPIQ